MNLAKGIIDISLIHITCFPTRILDVLIAYTSIYTFVCVWWLTDLNEELTEQAYVNVLTRGDLSSLRWISLPQRQFMASNSNMELCRVYYSSLNFRDIMLATGKLPPDAIPGRQCVQDGQHCILFVLRTIITTASSGLPVY